MVLIHHMPGWDEWYREATRKFAHHGYATISHNLYHRAGEGKADDVAAKARAEGGVADEQVIGDTEGAVQWLRAQPWHNGKVGAVRHLLGRAADLPVRLPAEEHRLRVRAVGRPRGRAGRADPEAAGLADQLDRRPVVPAARPVRQRGPRRRPRSRSTSTRRS